MFKKFLKDNSFYLMNALGLYIIMFWAYTEEPSIFPFIVGVLHTLYVGTIFIDWYKKQPGV